MNIDNRIVSDNRIVTDNDIIKANALFTEGHYTEALRVYEAGMKNGHTRAIFNYAYCLQYGYGIDPDPARAFELYTYLRFEEEGDAAYNAGAMLVTGRGVPCDPAEGYAYMLTAAECGCIEAQLYLAMVRLTGCVGEPDIISIRRIPFHRPDTPDSAFLLPPTPDENGEYADELMDKRFEIVEADEYEAIRYIRKAARHEGDYVGAAKGNAEYLLAKCAEEGLGRMYDRDKAIELYIRAAEDGSYDAFKKLKTLPQYEVDKARARLRMKPANTRKRIGESDEDED